MAYDEIKKDFGRRPVVIVELFLQRCLLTYSILPCEAALGVTGSTKCYNTLNTCQDPLNFDPDTTKPLRFSSERVDEIQQVGDVVTFPTVLRIDTAPTRLEPGRGLGIRSSVTVELMDHPWTDLGLDKYLGDASRVVGNPDLTGSFWGKLLARNKFWEGRRLDILTGYLDTEDGTFDATNFKRRTYIVEQIAGPDRRGHVSIVAKDPLKFADSDRTKIPAFSTGTLVDPLSSRSSGAGDTLQLPLGEAAQYVGVEFIRVGDEVMEIDEVDLVDDRLDVFRGTFPLFYPELIVMNLDGHDVGATVQACRLFDGVRVDDIISDLLLNDVGIDPLFIDLAVWAATFDAQIPTYIFSTLITEPTGIKELLVELTEHTILLWWDDREQEIRFEVLRPSAFVAIPTFDDESGLLADSFALNRSSKERISRVLTYYGQRNPTVDLETRNNFLQVNAQIDLDAETPEEFGSSRQLDIFSRWLPVSLAAVADEIGQRLLVEYRNTKILAQFAIDPKDDVQWTGDFVKVRTRYVQDEDGNSATQQYRIVEVRELFSDIGVRYQFLAIQTQLNGRVGVYAPDEDPIGTPYPTYPNASETQRLRAFWGDDDGNMSNGDIGYVWS